MKFCAAWLRAFLLVLTIVAATHGAPWIDFKQLSPGALIAAAERGEGKPAATAAPTASPTLHLAGGDYLLGEFRNCEEAGKLRWQSPAFAAPIDFPLTAVGTVSFPNRTAQVRPAKLARFELDGGDVLCGTLLALNGEEVLIESPSFGVLHVKRSAVQRIRRGGVTGDLLYAGPNGLLDWKESPTGAWEQDGAHLLTNRNEASLLGECLQAEQACVEFELSWTSDPEFTMNFGNRGAAKKQGDSEKGESGFRLEVLDRQLMLVAEIGEKADLAPLQALGSGAGRCHFSLYIDQKRNRVMAFAAEGGLRADLTIEGAAHRLEPCVRLVNHRGNVRLEQIYVTRWDGRPPQVTPGGKTQVRRADGTVVNGSIVGYDAAKKEFILADGDRKSRLAAEAAESIVLSSSGSLPKCDLCVICSGGMRLSGNLQKVQEDRFWLSRPGITEPLGIELSLLQNVVVRASQKSFAEVKGIRGRLEGDGLKLQGSLIEGGPAASSCLCWLPLASTTAAPLKPDFSGRVVYHEAVAQQPEAYSPPAGRVVFAAAAVAAPAAPAAAPVAAAPAPLGIVGAVLNVFGGDAPPAPAAPLRPRSTSSKSIYLRSGDQIPCEVKRIDERGVSFQSSWFEATFAPHEKIRAIELEIGYRNTKLDLAKRDRLTTLPRMQKDDPPTHLVRSIKGDYLRGRLIAMDDETLTIEVRQETRRVPRNQIASIIWLDKTANTDTPGAKDAAASGAPPVAAKAPLQLVQSLRSDGSRLTFHPEKVRGDTLSGKSEILGECRVQLDKIDQLLIGSRIDKEVLALPYQRWRWRPAVEPKYVQSKSGSGGASGVESDLVGKPAPEFEVETLDGQRFRLSEQRHKIVVLDFWATWCGPCMQSLPQLVGTVDTFRDKNVTLLAINLQEEPETIRTLLTRLDLKVAVGLDRTGGVAEKYAAVAIPQTVVIDGEGKIARLFVGGGPQYAEQISAAIQALLSPAPEQTKPAAP